MDYRALLKKYIEYVGFAEGVDFIRDGERRHEAGMEFTEAEWTELEALAKQVADANRAATS